MPVVGTKDLEILLAPMQIYALQHSLFMYQRKNFSDFKREIPLNFYETGRGKYVKCSMLIIAMSTCGDIGIPFSHYLVDFSANIGH